MIRGYLNHRFLSIRITALFAGLLLSSVILSSSCVKSTYNLDTGSDSDTDYYNWEELGNITVSKFTSFDIRHQSAASYGDYVFFISKGRSNIILYDLKSKNIVYDLKMKREDESVYHCNQSCFGKNKYDEEDPFPLLYISQRSQSDQRCFIEVFRILPVWDRRERSYTSFTVSLVQTIYLPAMSYDNSLGNANCIIDPSNDIMYTYSRNNDPSADNYRRCRISSFDIPDEKTNRVVLSNQDIQSSFELDCDAYTMQGGCVQDGYMYISQGYYNAGFIYLNIIDVKNGLLVYRIDLISLGVLWEPEGVFSYNNRVMVSHTSGISVIEKQ